jgi:hypothetical protein
VSEALTEVAKVSDRSRFNQMLHRLNGDSRAAFRRSFPNEAGLLPMLVVDEQRDGRPVKLWLKSRHVVTCRFDESLSAWIGPYGEIALEERGRPEVLCMEELAEANPTSCVKAETEA